MKTGLVAALKANASLLKIEVTDSSPIETDFFNDNEKQRLEYFV